MSLIFAIESSCDETAVALLKFHGLQAQPRAEVLADVMYSQLKEHIEYGGVVPELAARAHLERIDGLVAQALEKAGISLNDVDAFAATSGPGLLGGLLVGAGYTKSLALATGKPFLAMNHLEGHALSAHMSEQVDFPYLLLLVSGNHCQFLAVEGVSKYSLLGATRDDAIGECFDKVARVLGLGYPGGPAVEKLARQGDPAAVDLPRPLLHDGLDFSFSGLKSAVRRAGETLPEGEAGRQARADLAASFQQAVADVLARKTARALEKTGFKALVVAGGVAANRHLRAALETVCTEKNVTFHAPPLKWCTDNAVMIAYAAACRLATGVTDPAGDPLTFKPRPGWPLQSLTN